jgi:DNA-binding transcriptional LysR family regulator
VLIAPHDHPLASGGELELADIARYPLVLPPKRQITYAWWTRCSSATASPTPWHWKSAAGR